MADNELNKQIEQNKLDKIQIQKPTNVFDEMVKQQRSVFDLEDHKEQATKADSLEATKKEMQTIAEALANKDLKLKDETKAALLTRQNRDMSHAFINSKKLGGDSKEMKDIKEKLLAVEIALAENFDQKLEFKGNVHNLRKVYLAAIASCNSYLSTKTTYTRSDRYAMVRERLMNLMDELATINDIEVKVIESKQEDDTRLVNGYALLTAGRLMAWKAETSKINENENLINGLQEKPKKISMRDKIEQLDYQIETDDIAVQIIRLLTTEAKPQNFSKKANDDATNVTHFVYNLIKNFPEGVHSEMIHTGFAGYRGKGNKRTHKDSNGKTVMNNTMLQISQNKEGRLRLIVMKDGKQQVIDLPYGREAIIMNMQLDMADKEEVFGKEALNSTLNIIADTDISVYGTEIRNICLKLMSKYSGHKANDFDNISSKDIKDMTLNLLKGKITKEEVNQKIVEFEKLVIKGQREEESSTKTNQSTDEISTKTKKIINNVESLELLKKSKTIKEELESKVVFKQQEINEEKSDLPMWSKEEQCVANFFADFIYSKDTWDNDENVNTPGVRLIDLSVKNTEALSYIVANPQMAVNVLGNALPTDDTKEWEAIIEKLRGTILDALNLEKETSTSAEEIKEKLDVEFSSLKFKLGKVLLLKTFTEVNNKIDSILNAQTEQMQTIIGNNVDSFLTQDEAKTKEERVKDPYEKGITKEERDKRIEAGNEALDKMLKDSITGNSGQGLFIKNVFKQYFAGVSALDKRSMISWIIRGSRPIQIIEKTDEEYKSMTQEERDKYDKEIKSAKMKSTGLLMSGMIKGAGPLFQKIMQGVPTEVLPPEIKEAIEDVKSRLLPIPEEIVTTQLLAMVERSKGEVTKIEVTKSLGAASVGQAFLCKMYGPGYKDGKEVVVKLLRPDARNRMMREKSIMLECAGKTNEGMKTTYLGMLNQIEKELDLTIEASHVEKGDLYSKSSDSSVAMDGVVAMKLENVIAPTTNSLVIEKAEGTTVDSYMKEIDADILKKLEPFLVYEEKEGRKTVVYEDGIPKLNINYNDLTGLGQAKAAIGQMIQTAEKRQKHLITLSEKWVDEGLFGGGFYHGDLHAGNIIINDDKATIIDFGNATQLEEDQKQPVTSMIAAAAVGDWKLFRTCFHSLLPKDKETEKHYQDNRTAFGEQLKYVLNLGDKKHAGQRIGVALVKAQELGLELPAAIYNFSQCQLRLQNTVNDMNSKIEEMRKINAAIELSEKTLAMETFDPLEVVDVGIKRLPASEKRPYLIRMINNMKLLESLEQIGHAPVSPDMEDVMRDIFKTNRKDMVGPKKELEAWCEELADYDKDTIDVMVDAYIIQMKQSFKKNYSIEYTPDEIEQLRDIILNSKKGYKDKLDKFFSTHDDFSFDSVFKQLNDANKEYYKCNNELVEKNGPYYLLRDQYKKVVSLENIEKGKVKQQQEMEKEETEKEEKEKIKAKIEKIKENIEKLEKQREELYEPYIKLETEREVFVKRNDEAEEKRNKIYKFFKKVITHQEPLIVIDISNEDNQKQENKNRESSQNIPDAFGVYVQMWEKEFENSTKFAGTTTGNGKKEESPIMKKFIAQTQRYTDVEKYGKYGELFNEKLKEFRDFVGNYKGPNICRDSRPYLNKLKLLSSHIFCLELEKRLKNTEELETETVKSTEKLDDFTTAMGTVIDKNLMEAARRIGFIWSYKHKDQLRIES